MRFIHPVSRHEARWPYSLLTLNPPRDGLAAIVNHKQFPDAQIIIEDKQHYRWLTKAMPRFGRLKADYRVLAAVFLIMSTIALAVGFGIPLLSKVMTPLIPHSADKAIGSHLYENMLKNEELCETKAASAALQTILDRLEPNHAYELAVIQEAQENAMAIPGGYIILHSALIENASSAEELTGVIAHEIGHLKKRHSMRQLIHTLGIGFVIEALTGGSTLPVTLGIIATQMHYNRSQETEADRFAAELLIEKQIDPMAITAFFDRNLHGENFEEEGFLGKIEIPGYLSTHPNSQERIEMFEEKVASYRSNLATKPILTPAQWKQLQGICGNLE